MFVFPTVANTATGYDSVLSGSHVVTLPSGIQQGDLLVVCIDSRRYTSGALTINTPSGWTKLQGYSYPITSQFVSGLYYKIAGASEPGTVTFTTSYNSTRASWICYRITNFTGVPEAAISHSTAFSQSADPPTLSPSWGSAGCLWIAVADVYTSNVNITSLPSGYSNELVIDLSSSLYEIVDGASRNLEAASENPAAFVVSADSYWIAYTLALKGTQLIAEPQVQTNQASQIYQTTARLNGVLAFDGYEECDVAFDYGESVPYDYSTEWQPGYLSEQQFYDILSGLKPGTDYHFRAKAKNSVYTTYGDDNTFETSIPPVPIKKVLIMHPAIKAVYVYSNGQLLTSYENLSNLKENRIENSLEIPVMPPVSLDIVSLAGIHWTSEVK
jgi:hypothetical protein